VHLNSIFCGDVAGDSKNAVVFKILRQLGNYCGGVFAKIYSRLFVQVINELFDRRSEFSKGATKILWT
jgi:hypothetical protein